MGPGKLVCLMILAFGLLGFLFIISVVLALIPLYIAKHSGTPLTGSASNSLTDCQTLTAKFNTTCSSGPVTNIKATTGTNVTCLGLTGTSNSTVKIRVQSNGLPLFCPNIPMLDTFSEQNIDFEVNFNPAVSVNSPIFKPPTQSALDSILCNISSEMAPPSSSGYFLYSTPASGGTLAGISVDGVSIFNVNSANNQDPFYPSTAGPESVDQCLAHCNPTGAVYHYHIASGCALNPPSGNITSCSANTSCSSSIAAYSISTFTNYKQLTVIGIAKDGHIIYGPYNSDGTKVTKGFDICNGMFYDKIGNYGYFATQTFPYITGCFGPGNYPTITPSCTTNPASAYTRSYYARLFTTG
ncbi:unnamed protein product [Didymodactylos carnosus]|uniref:YHYH domain-containing protein n=1 Tax=Didymodactylos carnosus TaxID=1234261 RepID=A0A815NFU2_9BILA|nr:unnamed protein product [Didymodactylos carnosus]CAF4311436.1 unnamed protein product [Didymodactylos carnosus]